MVLEVRRFVVSLFGRLDGPAEIFDRPFPTRLTRAIFIFILSIIAGGGILIAAASYHYTELARRYDHNDRQREAYSRRFSGLAGEVDTLRSELKTQRRIYARMLTILDSSRTSMSKAQRGAFVETVFNESTKLYLNPMLVMAVMQLESNFQSNAVSSMGAVGMMQIMPSVGQKYARKAGVRWEGAETLLDPVSNVRIGIRYLKELMNIYENDYQLGLEAYNRGPGGLEIAMEDGQVPDTFSNHVMKLFFRFQKI